MSQQPNQHARPPLRAVNGHPHVTIQHDTSPPARRVRAGTTTAAPALPARDSALVDAVRHRAELKAEYQQGYLDGKRHMQRMAIGNWWFGLGFGAAMGLLLAGVLLRGAAA